MTAYYNEIDPYAAQWLRNLIAAGHIADGVVDTRSIEDVQPDDLRDFTQCHFFAGVGVWSHALRAAGWPDDRPVWTGSCPCQPFSAAGQGAGFADERHLWPAFHHLIKELRPATVLGEQVASSHIDPWIDLVHADLEALGYTFGAVPFPSAGVGAPHIRDRLYWVAHAEIVRRKGQHVRESGGLPPLGAAYFGGTNGLADHNGNGFGARSGAEFHDAKHHAEPCGGVRGLADDELQQRPGSAPSGDVPGGRQQESAALAGLRGDLRPGPTNGLWRDADWLGCTDGKWRPVEPGTFPLAHGAAGGLGRVRADQERLAALVPRQDQGSRAGRLRGYGNAINAEAARVWIEAVIGAA